MTKEEKQELERSFALIDKNKDGQISKEEFFEYLKENGTNISNRKIQIYVCFNLYFRTIRIRTMFLSSNFNFIY